MFLIYISFIRNRDTTLRIGSRCPFSLMSEPLRRTSQSLISHTSDDFPQTKRTKHTNVLVPTTMSKRWGVSGHIHSNGPMAFHFDSLPGEPSDDDVVLGRGAANAWRPGNARFLRVLDRNIARYYSSPSKKEKGDIIQQLYWSVVPQGRFLVQTEDGMFEPVDETAAKTKISHFLRYRRKRLSKQPSDSVFHETRRSDRPRNQAAVQRISSSAPPSTPNSTLAALQLPRPLFADLELFTDEELSSVLLGTENENDMMRPHFFDGLD